MIIAYTIARRLGTTFTKPDKGADRVEKGLQLHCGLQRMVGYNNSNTLYQNCCSVHYLH